VVKLIGRLLGLVRVAAANAVVMAERSRADRLEADNLQFRERVIPSLKRELSLEVAENLMLKEKLALWRMEIKKDQMILASQIPKLERD